MDGKKGVELDQEFYSRIYNSTDHRNITLSIQNFIHGNNKMGVKALIENKRVCQRNGKPVHIVAFVYAANTEFAFRTKMRAEMISQMEKLEASNNSYFKVVNFQYQFLLGKSRNDTVNKILREEDIMYHDVLQGDFIDSYYNVSLKSVFMLHWVKSFCQAANFIMKIDVDVSVNMTNLLDNVAKLPLLKQNYISGYEQKRNKVIRKPKHRYFVPKDLYPHKFWPPYVFGYAYIMSIDTVEALAKAAEVVPSFGQDDVYITGLLRQKAGVGIIPNFSFCHNGKRNKLKYKSCSVYHRFVGV